MGPHTVNELRFYDLDTGYTVNIAAFSVKLETCSNW
jgi:hypothetical protein